MKIAPSFSSAVVGLRNAIITLGYRYIAKPIFFKRDPESVHDMVVKIGKAGGKTWLGRGLASSLFYYSDSSLSQKILGIDFPNPVGLSAGFDKNAELTDILPCVGFGFAELGSFTGEPCAGNPKPRLWRLIPQKSLVIWYGLYNDGAEAISKRLAKKKFRIPIGTSIAKTNTPNVCETETSVADYEKSFRLFADIGDYTTVNISCPNTGGGEPFTDVANFNTLMDALDKVPTKKPVFVKFSPDLTDENLMGLINASKQHRVHGFICTNITKDRNDPEFKKMTAGVTLPEKGGMSGKIVEAKSNEMIRKVYREVGKTHIIVGVGGIFTAEDAYAKIKAGASLVQFITGMIFQGPQVVSEINRGLAKLARKDGYKNISEAIGADYRKK